MALPPRSRDEDGSSWIVALLDRNADGLLQRAELAGFIHAADSDGNGTIEAVERSALRARDARAAGAAAGDPAESATPHR
jgi:hypothetical protein